MWGVSYQPASLFSPCERCAWRGTWCLQPVPGHSRRWLRHQVLALWVQGQSQDVAEGAEDAHWHRPHLAAQRQVGRADLPTVMGSFWFVFWFFKKTLKKAQLHDISQSKTLSTTHFMSHWPSYNHLSAVDHLSQSSTSFTSMSFLDFGVLAAIFQPMHVSFQEL